MPLSLVVADTSRTEARYRMLETVRLYAHARLNASPHANEARAHHLEWFVRMAQAAASDMLGPNRANAMTFFEDEAGNLREALGWGLKGSGDVEEALRLAVAMRWYWLERGLFIEAREWLECGLRAADGRTSALLARTRGALGLFTYYLCDFARARVLLHECLDGLGDDETGERAFALGLLGFIEAVAGDARLAEQHAGEALALADRLGDDWVGGSLLAAGVLKGMAGDAGGAADILERACARLQHAGEAFMLTYVRVNLGLQRYLAGDTDRARCAFLDSLRGARDLRNIRAAGGCLEGLAYVAVSEGDARWAARLMGAAGAARALSRSPLFPQWRTAHDHNSQAVDSQLGSELADRERAAGAALAMDDLVGCLLAGTIA
jgi:non-specific serine/threonine protein kinase